MLHITWIVGLILAVIATWVVNNPGLAIYHSGNGDFIRRYRNIQGLCALTMLAGAVMFIIGLLGVCLK